MFSSSLSSRITPEIIQRLDDSLSKDYPELKKFLTLNRPDLMTAIANVDAQTLEDLSHEFKEDNEFEATDALYWFVRSLQKLHSSSTSVRPDSGPYKKVELLFVDCLLNGTEVQGVIDTGAQYSTISKQLAQKCRISYLIDERFATEAHGVGQQPVIGRIFGINLEISWLMVTINFVVINSFHSDYFLIGQDFLQANDCVIYCSDGRVFFRKEKYFVTTKSMQN